ncbi:MAG TPA: hypothetical protein VFK79_05165 [Xanthobacteraceae bacterium]|nr:hypothetical protein [Xanthobacteraceae bacterium]
MAITHDARPIFRPRQESLGPQTVFVAALMLAATAGIFGPRSFTPDMTLPIVATLLFASAAAASLLAWNHGATAQHHLTYWDVAGALTFIGIAIAALIDPEQMLRIVTGARG